MSKGFFITFEGGEGSGKTTQSKLLVKRLQALGLGAIWTKEPGSPHLSVCGKIRKVILDQENDMDSFTEALLFSADRSEHSLFLNDFLNDKLNKKVFVEPLDFLQDKRSRIAISDRYVDSTEVYQFYVHNLDPTFYGFIKSATRNLMPNLSILCNVDAELGLSRVIEKNRMENKGLEHHKKVNKSFMIHAKVNSDRFVIVDASKPIETLHEEIFLIVKERLEKAGLWDVKELL